PNQQTGRSAPMRLRALVAMSANFGVELDPSKLDRQDKDELAAALVRHKEIRRLVRLGDLYRLEDPFAGPRSAWLIVAKDKGEAVVFVVQPLASLQGLDPRPLRLAGLDPALDYRIPELDQTWNGEALMAGCLVPDLGKGDYAGALYRLLSR
ncbi:MAG TPA: GH36 C-terminal domain-containing protein, partial [bacterium]|nr:GH36 C-terminal domain-containing protein [bacterium]